MNVDYQLVPVDEPTKLVCSNCSTPSDRVILLAIGRLEPFKLCLPCVRVLRGMLPKADRPSRPISPKMRRILAWMAQTPADDGSLATISQAVGGYAYNALWSLLKRGMIEQHGGARSRSFRHCTFSITPRGLEELRP